MEPGGPAAKQEWETTGDRERHAGAIIISEITRSQLMIVVLKNSESFSPISANKSSASGVYPTVVLLP